MKAKKLIPLFYKATLFALVNLGLFAEVPDEVTLAAILDHELGHYVGQHSVEQFVRRKDGEFAIYSLKPLFSKLLSRQRVGK